MIKCKPRGLCNWNYQLESNGDKADTTIDWFHEEGTIQYGGLLFVINKHGLMSGHWTLEHDGVPLAQAFKESALSNTFEVEAAEYTLKIRPETMFSRKMIMEDGKKVVARIAPVHAMTRRARIETFHEEYDFVIMVFSFWLVTMIWKRQSGST